MSSNSYLLQLPDANSMPSRTLRDGISAMAIAAESSADAVALAKAQFGNDVNVMWDRATATLAAAATDMNGWAFRLRVVSPLGVALIDQTVEADAVLQGITAATGTLTSSANYADTETVTIDGKVYTFQSVLTNVDGHVKIGASEALSIVNLQHAINASGGVVGTDYATATTAHPTVTCTAVTIHTAVVTAKLKGTAGNALATTETSGTAAWGAVTLTGGQDATDKPSALAIKMVTALKATGHAAGADFDSTGHVLTVAATSDVLGDHRLFAYFIPAGADRSEVKGVPGFVVSKVDNGSAGAALTITLPVDSYIVPVIVALLGAGI